MKKAKSIAALVMAATLAVSALPAIAASGSAAQPRVDSLEVERYSRGNT